MTISKFNFPIYMTIVSMSIIIGMIYIYVLLKKEKKWSSIVGLYFILASYMTLVVGIILSLLINNAEFSLKNIGLTSYGGALGLIGSSLIFEKFVKMDQKLIKYSILSLPLIYGIAKIGCFLAGCCYGIPYSGIFSVTYVDGLNIKLFPVQLLESIIFIIIFIFINKYKNNKNIAFISIVIMSIFKFLLDFLRYEHYLKGFTVNQGLSLLILIGTLFLLFYKFKKNNVKSS